jgi:hypothetical protein
LALRHPQQEEHQNLKVLLLALQLQVEQKEEAGLKMDLLEVQVAREVQVAQEAAA